MLEPGGWAGHLVDNRNIIGRRARVPFAQVRAVSNLVERRNRDAWKLTDAIQNLSVETLRILNNA